MNPTLALNASFAALLGGLVGYGLQYLRPAAWQERASRAALWLGLAGLSAFLGLRWAEAGRPPMSNMYESLVLMTWGVLGIYLLLKGAAAAGLGIWATAFSLGLLALASLLDTSVRPLMPALRSNWLLYHVVVIMLGYAALALAGLLGAVYLARYRGLPAPGEAERKAAAESLAGLCFRSVNLGFVLLAGGIILGSVWANEAWGSYWSWDPKETWSLVAWLYYAVAIHLWRTRGWRGERFAWLCVIGLAVVGFTYFGVNYLLTGLHSYG